MKHHASKIIWHYSTFYTLSQRFIAFCKTKIKNILITLHNIERGFWTPLSVGLGCIITWLYHHSHHHNRLMMPCHVDIMSPYHSQVCILFFRLNAKTHAQIKTCTTLSQLWTTLSVGLHEICFPILSDKLNYRRPKILEQTFSQSVNKKEFLEA